jgi:hypothetical protein
MQKRGQAVAFGGSMEDGFQIPVVGLDVGVQREAVMIGSKGMDDTRIESRLATSPLDGLVIDAGHLYGHD